MYELYDGSGMCLYSGTFDFCKEYGEERIKKMGCCSVLTIWKDTTCIAVVLDDGNGVHTEVIEPSHNG